MNKMIRNVVVVLAMAGVATLAYAEPKDGANGAASAETGIAARDAAAEGTDKGVAMGVGIAAAIAVGIGIAVGVSNSDDNRATTTTSTR